MSVLDGYAPISKATAVEKERRDRWSKNPQERRKRIAENVAVGAIGGLSGIGGAQIADANRDRWWLKAHAHADKTAGPRPSAFDDKYDARHFYEEPQGSYYDEVRRERVPGSRGGFEHLKEPSKGRAQKMHAMYERTTHPHEKHAFGEKLRSMGVDPDNVGRTQDSWKTTTHRVYREPTWDQKWDASSKARNKGWDLHAEDVSSWNKSHKAAFGPKYKSLKVRGYAKGAAIGTAAGIGLGVGAAAIDRNTRWNKAKKTKKWGARPQA